MLNLLKEQASIIRIIKEALEGVGEVAGLIQFLRFKYGKDTVDAGITWGKGATPRFLPSAATQLTQFSLMAKECIRHVESATERLMQPQQIQYLKKALQEKEFVKLGETAKMQHRDLFRSKKNNLIAQWEQSTGQQWPTYIQDVIGKKGTPIKKAGAKYDAHEIIPNSYGGPLEWWNIHPARFPDQHQAVIHGANAPIREIMKHIEKK